MERLLIIVVVFLFAGCIDTPPMLEEGTKVLVGKDTLYVTDSRHNLVDLLSTRTETIPKSLVGTVEDKRYLFFRKSGFTCYTVAYIGKVEESISEFTYNPVMHINEEERFW